MKQTWWQHLEDVLLHEVEEIDHRVFWDAYMSGNETEQRQLALRRTGIVALFTELHKLPEVIKYVREQIEQLNAGEDARQQIEDTLNV